MSIIVLTITFEVAHAAVEWKYITTMYSEVDFQATDGIPYIIEQDMRDKHPTLSSARAWFNKPSTGIYETILKVSEAAWLKEIYEKRFGKGSYGR
jgi:hypothetical protein